MSAAQRLFVVTSWLFIILASLLFLVPSKFPSAEAAAWVSLGAGAVSHLALLAAIVYDQIPGTPDNPPAGG